MCGILGYIGTPVDYKATFDLTNALLVKTESRGTDATGFWGCVNGKDRVFYHKEPVKSSLFVESDIWKETSKFKFDLMLGHCRWTSYGSGNEKINKNNHPHVSKDFRVALIHNGKIPEYDHLKKQYPVLTDCDSEILLRIFESGEDFREQQEFLSSQLQKAKTSISDLYRMYGLKKIFSEVNYGAMAVALGEFLDNDERALWLFHNGSRPLCLIDLRETMGQFFFCSTPEIFRAAVEDAKIPSRLVPLNQGVIKLPSDWIYHFRMNKAGEVNWEKIKVNKERRYGCWENDREEKEPVEKSEKMSRECVEIVSHLDEDEEVIQVAVEEEEEDLIPSVIFKSKSTLLHEDFNSTKIADDSSQIEHLCEHGIEYFRRIAANAQNSVKEGNVQSYEIEQIVDSLTDIVRDLQNTAYLIR